MIKKMKYLLAWMASLPALAGCYYDHEELLYPAVTALPDTVTYVSHIQPLTGAHCAISGCHVNGTGLPALGTYSEVRALGESGKLKQRLIAEQSMPPSGPLPTNQQQLIEKWINTGFTEK